MLLELSKINNYQSSGEVTALFIAISEMTSVIQRGPIPKKSLENMINLEVKVAFQFHICLGQKLWNLTFLWYQSDFDLCVVEIVLFYSAKPTSFLLWIHTWHNCQWVKEKLVHIAKSILVLNLKLEHEQAWKSFVINFILVILYLKSSKLHDQHLVFQEHNHPWWNQWSK